MSDSKFLDNEGLDYYTERLVAYLQSLSWPSSTGVESFAGRSGSVEPQSGDYTADMVGAVPTTRTVNGKALSSDITLSASDVSAVPTTRTVNAKPLSANISLTASDVGALSSTGTAAAATKLATSRTIQTNLASTSSASFNGTASITPGVTGTLPVANGGTGGTSATLAMYQLISPLTEIVQTYLENYPAGCYIPLARGSTTSKVSVKMLKSVINSDGASVTTGSYVGSGSSSFTIDFGRSWSLFVVGSASYDTQYGSLAISIKGCSNNWTWRGVGFTIQEITTTDTAVQFKNGYINAASTTYFWVAI